MTDLQNNPETAEQFREAFGFLPEGFAQGAAQPRASEPVEVPRPSGNAQQFTTREEADREEAERRRAASEQSSAGSWGGGAKRAARGEGRSDGEAARLNRLYSRFKKGARQSVIELSAQDMQELLDSGRMAKKDLATVQAMLAHLDALATASR